MLPTFANNSENVNTHQKPAAAVYEIAVSINGCSLKQPLFLIMVVLTEMEDFSEPIKEEDRCRGRWDFLLLFLLRKSKWKTGQTFIWVRLQVVSKKIVSASHRFLKQIDLFDFLNSETSLASLSCFFRWIICLHLILPCVSSSPTPIMLLYGLPLGLLPGSCNLTPFIQQNHRPCFFQILITSVTFTQSAVFSIPDLRH